MNKVEILGNLTNEVETRYTQDGKVIATFNVAVNRKFKKENEERKADFFRLIAFGSTGEFIQKYFHKGQGVALVGRLQNNNYEDKNGVKHYTNDIIVEEVFFAGSSKENNTNNDNFEFTPTTIFGDDGFSDLPF